MPKISSRIKTKRKLVTIADVLARDDVNEVLAGLEKDKAHISDMVVMYIDRRDGCLYSEMTENTTVSMVTWMCEVVKSHMISDDEE